MTGLAPSAAAAEVLATALGVPAELASCAGEAGAKVLLVGDWAQLSSIEAGGAVRLIVRDGGTTAPELLGVQGTGGAQ